MPGNQLLFLVAHFRNIEKLSVAKNIFSFDIELKVKK